MKKNKIKEPILPDLDLEDNLEMPIVPEVSVPEVEIPNMEDELKIETSKFKKQPKKTSETKKKETKETPKEDKAYFEAVEEERKLVASLQNPGLHRLELLRTIKQKEKTLIELGNALLERMDRTNELLEKLTKTK